jgi:PAS domain S-box-containing protein
MSTAIMEDADGKPTGLVAVSRDITERKRTEEAFQESERRYRLLAENVTDVIFTTDLELNLTYVSPSVMGLTGYTVQEAIARRVEQILTPASFEVASNTLVEELAVENMEQKDLLRSRTLELKINRKDGSTFTTEMRMSFLRQPGGRAVAVLGVARDITERKRAEEALTKKKEELEQKTNQLQAVNKELEAFTYSVSHDLRAPLRSIDGFSQVLLEDYTDRLDDEGKSYFMRVRSASQRMAELIDDLLNLSRVTRGEMRYETVDLSALAQTVSMEIQQSQPERDVEFTIAPGLVTKGDTHLLRVVLENLLGNAWKFTNKRERARIEFGYAETDGQPAYFVRDNGAGFDMAYADRLFGAFQRLHSEKEFWGTGIGLATVQRIIHRHGGSTWAEGAVEKGATFYFTL